MKKSKKVLEIENTKGRSIQELLFLCVERDYTMSKAKRFIGVSLNKTVYAYIKKYAPILSDHKFRHSNVEFSRKRASHLRRLKTALKKRVSILVDGFLMTRKEHCKRLGVKYDTFLKRKREFGLSDVEALGIDMSWKFEIKNKIKIKNKDKIIKLGADDGLPIKTISYRYGIPRRVSAAVMTEYRESLKASGLIKTSEAVNLSGISEYNFRYRYRSCRDFPSPIKIGRYLYWNKEEIELYANKANK